MATTLKTLSCSAAMLVWVLAIACGEAASSGASGGQGGEDGDGTGTDGDGDSDGDGDADGDGDSDGDGDPDGDGDGDGGFDTDDSCAEVTEIAVAEKVPVDIIIAVDDSPSMTTEISMVQKNMNLFSQQIVASGVDAHIVLIDSLVCVPAPLGSGSCPGDTKLPEFRHVRTLIESWWALSLVPANHALWKDSRRPDAHVHFVVVTDDNSTPTPAMFRASLKALSPPITEFTFHAIASPVNQLNACIPPNTHCCGIVQDRGSVYQTLVDQTGGIFGDICKQEFQPIFDELATEIGKISIACEWVIPEPPEGEELDPKQVNVDFVDDQDEVNEIGYVESEADCEDVEDAWYYDDPEDPEKIYVCPQTCDWMLEQAKAEIRIKFGCETWIAAPV